MEQLLRVGVISSTHGVKGKEQLKLEIEGVKFFKNMVILKFKGYDTIEDIEKYKGKDILVTRDQAVKLGPDENFIVDLIGLKVVTEDGEPFGTLTDVIKTGANDVYEVKTAEGGFRGGSDYGPYYGRTSGLIRRKT